MSSSQYAKVPGLFTKSIFFFFLAGGKGERGGSGKHCVFPLKGIHSHTCMFIQYYKGRLTHVWGHFYLLLPISGICSTLKTEFLIFLELRPFIHHQNDDKKMRHRMRWLFNYLVNFYFIYFLLHVEELSFCFQFFTFNCNFDFFYQWWQIIKRNVVLFTKKVRCGRVMMNEWLWVVLYTFVIENRSLIA